MTALTCFLSLVVLASTAHAQVVVNPRVVSFIPSADHDAVDASGQPVVTEYDLALYVAGTSQPFQVLSLGKPAPAADGYVSVDFYSMLGAPPMPGQDLQASVAAVGPGGRGDSTLSNTFKFDCAFTVSPTSLSIAALGGNATLSVSCATAGCGWDATSNATWITVTSGAIGSSNGTVGLSIAPNPATSPRTGTLSVAGITVTVTEDAGTNKAPTVGMTSPAAGSTFTAPATITLSANASDTDGTVAGVSFLANGNIVAADTSAPYSAVWGGVAAGSYTITAVATDNTGTPTTSVPVTISVKAPNVAPAVRVDSPANGAVFTAPANITITATAADGDGTIASVTFWAGGGMVGTLTSSTSSTSSTYAVTWPNVGAGSYVITAVATDNAGATTTSSAVTVKVDAPAPPPPTNTAPTVQITSPKTGSTIAAPPAMTISATAVDKEGPIARVEFYANSGLIGTATSSPYFVKWNPTLSGGYTLTAVAVDGAGLQTTSAPVSITVRRKNGKK